MLFVIKRLVIRIMENSCNRDFVIQTFDTRKQLLIQKVGFVNDVDIVPNVGALQVGEVRVAGGNRRLAVLVCGGWETFRSGQVDQRPCEPELASHARVLRRNDFRIDLRPSEVQAVLIEQNHFIWESAVVGVWENGVQFVRKHPRVLEVVVKIGILV